jgi:hypothetical protein
VRIPNQARQDALLTYMLAFPGMFGPAPRPIPARGRVPGSPQDPYALLPPIGRPGPDRTVFTTRGSVPGPRTSPRVGTERVPKAATGGTLGPTDIPAGSRVPIEGPNAFPVGARLPFGRVVGPDGVVVQGPWPRRRTGSARVPRY